MKKILLASTILAGTAGFAAADTTNFTFSGSAYTGIAFAIGWDELAGEDLDGDGVFGETDVTIFQPEVNVEFTVAMMTTTDGGLEAGAEFDITGNGVEMEDDHTEGNFGTVEYQGGLGDVTVYLSGEWGKFQAEYDGFNAYTLPLVGSGGNIDFTYTNSFGDFDIKVWYEYVFGADNDEYGAQGTYNFGDYAVWAGAEYQQDIGIPLFTGDWEIWAGASASMNGFSGEVEASYRLDSEEWAFYAEVGYTVDAFSFGAFIEDDDNGFIADDDFDYGVNASYDLGGGVSVDAAYIFDQDTGPDGIGVAKAGVSMSF